MGILLAIIIILLAIVIHEYGHFISARLLGVPVESFNIGFGPAIWSRRSEKSGVLYAVRAFPLGGYVSFVANEDESKINQTLVEDSIENAPAWKRIIVYLAGPFANILTGFLIVVALLCTIGTFDTTTLVTDVGTKGDGSPEPVLEIGDEIWQVDGTYVSHGSEVRTAILGDDEHEGAISEKDTVVRLWVLRGDETKTLDVDMATTTFNMAMPENNPLFLTDAIAEGFNLSVLSVKTVVESIVGMLGDLLSGLGVSEDVGSVVGAASMMNDKFNDVNSGVNEVASLEAGTLEAQRATISLYINIWQFCFYAAALSFSLGVFNLIPFPGLDGAKVIVAVVEGVTRRKLNTTARAIIIVIGFALLLVFGGWLIVRDIMNIAA